MTCSTTCDDGCSPPGGRVRLSAAGMSAGRASDRLQPPDSFERVPQLWHRLMTHVLGYRRFGAHGDDIGAMVSNRLAAELGESVLGLHVTFPAEPELLAEDLRAFFRDLR
jgi:hypothetical protein